MIVGADTVRSNAHGFTDDIWLFDDQFGVRIRQETGDEAGVAQILQLLLCPKMHRVFDLFLLRLRRRVFVVGIKR